MSDTDRVRILVLGDSGVGKTSLVHLIARGEPLTSITYTIGASIEVKLHEYKEGTPSQKSFWIGEFRILMEEEYSQKCGNIFQNFLMLVDLTAIEIQDTFSTTITKVSS